MTFLFVFGLLSRKLLDDRRKAQWPTGTVERLPSHWFVRAARATDAAVVKVVRLCRLVLAVLVPKFVRAKKIVPDLTVSSVGVALRKQKGRAA